MSGSSALNRRVKSWPSWLAMVIVVVVFTVVGSTRSSGPQTPSDRVDDITRRIACPVCDGESVFESQNNSSRSIRNRVEELVRENEQGDQEIVEDILNAFGGDLLLVPKASGLDALVWVLPAMGFVVGVTGLTLAFRRWKLEADGVGEVTDADRALVDAAMARDDAAEELAAEELATEELAAGSSDSSSGDEATATSDDRDVP